MSILRPSTPVKYFFSVLFDQNIHSLEEVELLLRQQFNRLDHFFPQFNPLFEYYSKEMGDSLVRVIFYSDEHKDRDELINLKKWGFVAGKKIEPDGIDKILLLTAGLLLFISCCAVIVSFVKPLAKALFDQLYANF